MSDVTAPVTLRKQPVESRLYSVDFTSLLASGVTLTGTPTVAEVATSGLTITEKAVNVSVILRKNGSQIAIGKAVQFRVAGGTDGVTYRIQSTCGDTAGNTLAVDVLLEVTDT